MTWKMLVVFFRETYEEMFKLAGANLLWVLCAAPLVTLPPATVALYAYIREVLLHHDPDMGEYFRLFRKWGLRSYPVFFLGLACVMIPGWAALFYLQWAETAGWIGLLLAALNLWLMLFCLAAQVYLIPFLVHQEVSISLAARRAALMVLLRPGMTVTALLVWVILWAANIFPPYFFFLFAALVALLKMTALLVGLEEYQDLDGDPGPVHPGGGTEWINR